MIADNTHAGRLEGDRDRLECGEERGRAIDGPDWVPLMGQCEGVSALADEPGATAIHQFTAGRHPHQQSSHDQQHNTLPNSNPHLPTGKTTNSKTMLLDLFLL